jgi:hypothetical protein
MNEEIKVPEAKEEKKHISFSEYTTFRNCPFQWYLSYVKEIKSPENEFLVFGSTLHNSIEEIIKKDIKSHMSYHMVFKNLLKKNSNGIYSETYFGKNMLNEGVALLKQLNYHERFKDYELITDEEKIISIEEEIYEPLTEIDGEQIYFKGYIDWSGRHKQTNRHLILDWKSSVYPWNLEKKAGTIPFETIYNKIQNKEELTEEEIGNLQLKFYFGQVMLYKYFLSKKHNMPLENIDAGYGVLTRKPIQVQEYIVEHSEIFLKFILEDITNVIKQIYQIKRNLKEKEIVKSKDVRGLLKSCQYCHHKSKDCIK